MRNQRLHQIYCFTGISRTILLTAYSCRYSPQVSARSVTRRLEGARSSDRSPHLPTRTNKSDDMVQALLPGQQICKGTVKRLCTNYCWWYSVHLRYLCFIKCCNFQTHPPPVGAIPCYAYRKAKQEQEERNAEMGGAGLLNGQPSQAASSM